jgi:hypothetical protein
MIQTRNKVAEVTAEHHDNGLADRRRLASQRRPAADLVAGDSGDRPAAVGARHEPLPPEDANAKRRFLFRLFVTGADPKHARVAEGLRRLLANKCHKCCQLEVVDVHEQPELAERTKILATPTLVRVCPQPAQRVVGELAACTRILADMGLRPNEWPTRPAQPTTEPAGSLSAQSERE